MDEARPASSSRPEWTAAPDPRFRVGNMSGTTLSRHLPTCANGASSGSRLDSGNNELHHVHIDGTDATHGFGRHTRGLNRCPAVDRSDPARPRSRSAGVLGTAVPP